jgi:ABC-2 type transporter
LDAYNAYNVIECLVTLARDFNRTIVFTIHQPRSNIVALFDQLILLAEGKMVYSGPLDKCQNYFDQIGHPCPPGFNIADYLVDLTKHASRPDSDEPSPLPTPTRSDSEELGQAENATPGEEQPIPLIRRGRKNSIREWQEHQLYDPRPRSKDSGPSLRDELGTTQQWASIGGQSAAPLSVSGTSTPQNGQRATVRRQRQTAEIEAHAREHLATLLYSYQNSDISSEIKEEIYDAITGHDQDENVNEEVPRMKRVGWLTQFLILSRRTFKNLYRSPMLMLTHYSIAILMARITLLERC